MQYEKQFATAHGQFDGLRRRMIPMHIFMKAVQD
jgi:hypothetical protein